MTRFLFITQTCGTKLIMADDINHAWDKFETSGFHRSECLKVSED